MIQSNYKILYLGKNILIIEDIGPHGIYKSITNDIENVVAKLYKQKFLTDKTDFYYIDSLGYLCKVGHAEGRFQEWIN